MKLWLPQFGQGEKKGKRVSQALSPLYRSNSSELLDDRGKEERLVRGE